MAKRPTTRQCPRCGFHRPRKEKQCGHCGTWLVKKRFVMTKARIAAVHALVKQKGLDRELYELRLGAYGVSSCKEFKRDGFYQFMKDLEKLPDAMRRAG